MWKMFFKISLGTVGDAYVKELARIFHAFSDCFAMESIGLKAAMVFPIKSLTQIIVPDKGSFTNAFF